MRGEGAARHFTYRAIKALREVITDNYKGCPKNCQVARKNLEESTSIKNDASHTNCPQAVSQIGKELRGVSNQQVF